MKPNTHAVIETEEGFRVVVCLMESENEIPHLEFAEHRAYPTRFGADAQAALLNDLALTPVPVSERECA